MEPAKNSSKTKYIVIGGIVVAIVLILGGAIYALTQLRSQDNQAQTDTSSSQTVDSPKNDKTVTQQTLNQGMSDLDETMKQSKEAHSEASAAVNDSAKRVKVSE